MISPSGLWFNFIHSRCLVYNTCWEDSKADRKLLSIDESSRLMVITSAGDNVLDYLIESPATINSIDINPKQTALLELKIALIRYGDYQLFFEFFGKGKSLHFRRVYGEIRKTLTKKTRNYWDFKIKYFDPNGRGLYYQGGSGWFARYLIYVINKKGLRFLLNQLIEESDITIREQLFNEIEINLWDGFESWFWKSPLMLSLAGIPESQRKAVGDLNGFIRQPLYNIFVQQGAKNNYHWRIYIEGCYSKECCPDYLKEENFEALRSAVDKIRLTTSSVSSDLENNTERYTHFILLDHMDWLVSDNNEALTIQWVKMIERAELGSEFLFRTAFSDLSFLPGIAHEKVLFKKVDPEWVAKNDQVGTYPGTYIGVLK